MCEYIILKDFNIYKYIYNRKIDLWYELQEDYYIHCLELPAKKEERHDKTRRQQSIRQFADEWRNY